MNTQLQQLVYANNKIFKKEPSRQLSSQNSIAIVVHIFYIDIWREIARYLEKLEVQYDLYVTVPQGASDSDVIHIMEDAPNARAYMTENRGRDVLPFLEVLNLIGTKNYDYICKLHTKKTGDSALGNVWRKLLYFDLIGSNTIVKNILNLFKENPNIGIVTGKNTILDSQRYTYGNSSSIEILTKKAGLEFSEEYLFPAGTMFWIDTKLLEPILRLFREGELEFEKEKGQKDNTLAHAIERFFGIVAQVKNRKIVKSPSKYSKIGNTTLNEVAGLVLSQQYVGLDVFTDQKQQIENFKETIIVKDQQLQDMRISNRVKRLMPNKILSITASTSSLLRSAPSIVKTVIKNPLVLKKVFYYLKRGEISYLLTKTKEKSKKNLAQTDNLVTIKPNEYFQNFNVEEYSLDNTIIDIVIPVYNGYEYLEALFDSLEKNTSSPHRLIVVNDCSPDKKVKPYLEKRLKKHSNAIFMDNKENLGFVQSVNLAVEDVKNHFVILNTDTELPPSWIERLMFPILNSSKIASTTPFTNAGTIASFPNFLEDNEIFEELSVSELDEVFCEVNPNDFYTPLPTGVGFCMGVNYDLVKEIGFFDEETFGKGYGEENDWCQRAIGQGYTNILVPNLFVYHKHGGSFPSEEKQKLIDENYIKLLKKHPNYGKDVQTYIEQNPHEVLRNIFIMVASSKKTGINLIFDHDLGGGANIYANELIERYIKEEKNTLTVRYDFYSNNFKFFYNYKNYTFNFRVTSFEEVQMLLSKLNIEELFLNSLVSFRDSHEILNYIHILVEEKNIKLILPIHDFYPICPNYTLLNDEGIYCDIPSLEKCSLCMQKNALEWKSFYSDIIDMKLWREFWIKLLQQSSNILCFSNSSKEILLKAYPKLNQTNIEVIPHQVAPLAPVKIQRDESSNKITIGVLGAINYAKGSLIIKNMVKTIERENLDIDMVVIGEITENINSKHFHATGRYKRDELPDIIKNQNIDIFLIPSIWPETFSYTTQEIIMMELPLMVFNLGAPAERVSKYNKGYIVDEVSVEAVLETLEIFKTKLFQSTQEIIKSLKPKIK